MQNPQDFLTKAEQFLNEQLKLIKTLRLDLQDWQVDHLCYRVESRQRYEEMKVFLNSFATLLIESMVGGRLIATFKLERPLKSNQGKTSLIELPAPKKGRDDHEGFEHLEIVTPLSFDDLQGQYPNLDFKESRKLNDFNNELKLKLSERTQVKFHHMSLERVIEIEKSQNSV
jgi:predicted metalloenzyme YecM